MLPEGRFYFCYMPVSTAQQRLLRTKKRCLLVGGRNNQYFCSRAACCGKRNPQTHENVIKQFRYRRAFARASRQL